MAVFFLYALFYSGASFAKDWPQYRGANHDGISTDRIIKQWTGAVTNPVWRVWLANGISSFAVSDGRACTQVARTNAALATNLEYCIALNITNGAELWATPVDFASYPNAGVGSDDGPRSTPTLDGGSVFVLSSNLKLLRLNATNGSVIWSNNLPTRYGGSVISWQSAASPVLEGNLLFVNANASPSRLMAFHASDGSLAWRMQNESMTHATPVLATIQGVHQIIFASQSGLVSVDPASGNLFWKYSHPFTYNMCLAVSPVVYQNLIFYTAGQNYGKRAIGLAVTNSESGWVVQQLWTNNCSSTWMTPVMVQGFLYGQFDDGRLKCINMQTGNTNWASAAANFGKGGTILVDNSLVSITENGQLVLLQPNPSAYTELGRFLAIPYFNSSTNKCWNSPAICDGRIYVRSTAYAECFDLSIPDLKLDPPSLVAPGQVDLAVRTVNGTALSAERMGNIGLWTSSDLGVPLLQWSKVENSSVLWNGVVLFQGIDIGVGERRYFVVREL